MKVINKKKRKKKEKVRKKDIKEQPLIYFKAIVSALIFLSSL